jgi:hypothetical protein
MGWNRTRSSNFGGQATSSRGTAGNLSAACTRPIRDENQARWHILNTSGGKGLGWSEVLLDLARALGAQPAA